MVDFIAQRVSCMVVIIHGVFTPIRRMMLALCLAAGYAL